MALGVARKNIRVNAIAPGSVMTPLLKGMFGSEQAARDTVLPMIPMGRISDPSEIASLVLYLSSDAASFITGQAVVIDGGGSLRCALVGDQLAILAHKNGWESAVVYGCIRDSGDINGIDIGVRALKTHPQKSIKKGAGDRDIAVTFGGVTFNPGEYLYADEDGVLVSSKPLC